VADVDPVRKRLAKFVRMLGSSHIDERRTAFGKLEDAMQNEGLGWSDIGNFIEGTNDGKYTEAEMVEFAQVARAEGVEAGIKIGTARASNGSGIGNGQLSLPKPFEMAEYCHDRLHRLQDDKQRDFISDMFVITQRGARLSSSRLSYLVSIFIKVSGKTG
jgi:hypothetical protein